MKKRILSLLLCLCTILLTGCGGTTSQDTSSAGPESSAVSVETEPASSDPVSSENVSSEVPSEPVSSEEISSEEIDIHHLFMEGDIQPVYPETLPKYEKGSIKLYDRTAVDGTPNNREKRFVYYGSFELVDIGIWRLMDTDYPGDESRGGASYNPVGWREWCESYFGDADRDWFNSNDPEPEEMPLVSLIKFYNIPREVMEEAIELYYGDYIENAYEFYTPTPDMERGEIPNLDIIYTLDNEIINEYYRYG